jgi:hypothetical protein
VLRGEFDTYGGSRRWFELFQESENRAPMGHYAMSEFSRNLLRCGFDYEQISNRRRSNYAALSNPLRRLAVFPDLPEGVVPLGFPIRSSGRRRIREHLFANEIYPSIHWAIEGLVPSEFGASHRLAGDILTLPCDQRYDVAEMERVARRVLEIATS